MADKGKRNVETTLEVEAPRGAVWKALTEASELVRWFPLEAEVEPRVGGRYWISWKNEWQGEHRIRVFEPERHLRTTWATAVQEGDGPTQLTVDYHLEGEGGRTVLRLVHSGFGKSAAWDEEFDGVRLGWTFELRSLRHYLERHRGQDRHAIFVVGPKRELSTEEVWTRVLRDGLGATPPSGLREGDRYSLAVGDGETFSGTVLSFEPPRQLAGTVDRLDDAIFRVEVFDRRPHLWLAVWGNDGSALSRYESRWRDALARALPEEVAASRRRF